jgi:hypothetical protein
MGEGRRDDAARIVDQLHPPIVQAGTPQAARHAEPATTQAGKVIGTGVDK